MAEYSELETLKANGCDGGNTIRTPFAKIIVSGTPNRPYYEILYFDTEDRNWHIGWGSYFLEYVFKWLSKEFETISDEQTADVAMVRHGKWIDHCVRDWRCSVCGEEINKVRHVDGYCYDDKPDYCPNCGARMDGDGNDR